MKLIVGLGNPGSQYESTLHNVGFMVIDELARQLQIPSFQNKFQSLIAKSSLAEENFILMKPNTYMNLSGNAVIACTQFFKISPSDILVISDDLELQPGRARLRKDGGHGGHNGLRSITDCLGSKGFKRIRVGIGRPDGKISVSNYVLGKGKPATWDAIEQITPQVVDHIMTYLRTSTFENTSIQI